LSDLHRGEIGSEKWLSIDFHSGPDRFTDTDAAQSTQANLLLIDAGLAFGTKGNNLVRCIQYLAAIPGSCGSDHTGIDAEFDQFIAPFISQYQGYLDAPVPVLCFSGEVTNLLHTGSVTYVNGISGSTYQWSCGDNSDDPSFIL
jgi:hypothetical protein